MSDISYLQSVVKSHHIIPSSGSRNRFHGKLQELGSNPTNAQKLDFMYDVACNSPIAFRREGQFGEDPEILTLFTPAGSTQLGRLNFSDSVLNMYTVDNTFSIVSLGNAIGPIDTTFQPSLTSFETPLTLVSVIGNIGAIKMRGYYPVATGDSDAGPGDGAIANVIGQDITLNSDINNRNSLIESVNAIFSQKTAFLLSFCKETSFASPSPSTYVAEMVAALKVILGNNELDVSGGGGDDMSKCILGVAQISSGTPTTPTVTKNICPTLTGAGGITCSTASGTYATKEQCKTGTGNYFTSINGPDAASVFTKAINDVVIKPILLGEICAQHPES